MRACVCVCVCVLREVERESNWVGEGRWRTQSTLMGKKNLAEYEEESDDY